ncbi:hypothetical protein DFP72DRAFT_1074750 [Ephemerocybe angulata]|uniref:Uncharacterized protein n=1 Tax=Ephemerocybe angulata TaxID=980116 RepID=A0A8H6HKL7_9AGAR|nr:hypothetical protein DFP72DRAFT_1074750 [Tulosesus angulatus]
MASQSPPGSRYSSLAPEDGPPPTQEEWYPTIMNIAPTLDAVSHFFRSMPPPTDAALHMTRWGPYLLPGKFPEDSDHMILPDISIASCQMRLLGLASLRPRFLRLPNIPFILDAKTNLHIKPEDITRTLEASPLRSDLVLAGSPCVVRNSKSSTRCDVFFDIWDSQQRLHAQQAPV